VNRAITCFLITLECFRVGFMLSFYFYYLTDVNECTAGTHTCHVTLAACTNTEGGFTCACNSGYSGNGVTCTEIDECALGTHECDSVFGTCTNTPGSYTCACATGYALGTDQKSCIGKIFGKY